MQINIEDQRLPKIYKRNGKDCYLDAIRKRLIYITPEETVRQRVISYLLDILDVPSTAIRVEEHLSHYGVNSRRRADIIIERFDADRNVLIPLVIIECKAPQVAITEKVFDQMFDYSDLIGAEYVMATNGYQAEYYHYSDKEKGYVHIKEFPAYVEMIRGKFEPLPQYDKIERMSYEDIFVNDKWKEYIGYEVGESTPEIKAKAAVNFYDSLLYSSSKLPEKEYHIFKLIKDYGTRILEYGNHGGGSFAGVYHSYLIDYKGSTEFVSIGLSTYVTSAHPDIVKTTLNVAIDNEKTSHHSLQLVIDDNLEINGNNCTFYHHGRIGIGNIGSGKKDELRMYIADIYPDIIDGGRFNLGTMVNDHLWNADEEDMMRLIENLISYALVRDEYREYVKSRR